MIENGRRGMTRRAFLGSALASIGFLFASPLAAIASEMTSTGVSESLDGAFEQNTVGLIDIEGRPHRYSQFVRLNERVVRLVDLSNGCMTEVSFNPDSGVLSVDGVVCETHSIQGGENMLSMSPNSEEWVGGDPITVYISWGASATAAAVVAAICAAVGTVAFPAVWGVIGTVASTLAGSFTGCYLTYDFEFQTIGMYQNRRLVLSLKAPDGSYYEPYYVYM